MDPTVFVRLPTPMRNPADCRPSLSFRAMSRHDPTTHTRSSTCPASVGSRESGVGQHWPRAIATRMRVKSRLRRSFISAFWRNVGGAHPTLISTDTPTPAILMYRVGPVTSRTSILSWSVNCWCVAVSESPPCPALYNMLSFIDALIDGALPTPD
ncbi:hypothetical protein EVG20_g11522 [Dentipellis fragilis]|uniref:Uncharacterized protein n=1 Tax=Dentipellis fragilis TaxID=205917 RepID=A0A4Y9XKE9_9AGAM|nr:hypothetical protein EVG20_g11522 [Dentipellis fragilis]